MCDEGLLFHVTRDHNFKNENLFYRFNEDEVSHGKTTKDEFGHNVSLWRKFAESLSGGVNLESPINNMSRIPGLPAQDLEVNVSDMEQLIENVPPVDEHNIHLLDNVHPSPWEQPGDPAVKERFYNLVVLGGGTAGLVSSIGSQSVGAKVAMIESHFLGGDCTNFGCVPSKLLIKVIYYSVAQQHFISLSLQYIKLFYSYSYAFSLECKGCEAHEKCIGVWC